MSEIIAVEGFWGLGKSTLAARISEELDTELLNEPDHYISGIVSNVSDWYYQEFITRYELARQSHRPTVIERTLASVISYDQSMGLDVPFAWPRSYRLATTVMLQSPEGFEGTDQFRGQSKKNNAISRPGFLTIYEKLLEQNIRKISERVIVLTAYDQSQAGQLIEILRPNFS